YAIKYESAKTLTDIMLRRTGTGTLGNPGKDIINKTASLAAELLHWDSKRTEEEIASLLRIYDIF
ncbi:MAG: hypothetical protein JXN62_01410, partial [Bacteroidales bacterium]|nr:hypothetical protein [Bacteroidales bacterium]